MNLILIVGNAPTVIKELPGYFRPRFDKDTSIKLRFKTPEGFGYDRPLGPVESCDPDDQEQFTTLKMPVDGLQSPLMAS